MRIGGVPFAGPLALREREFPQADEPPRCVRAGARACDGVGLHDRPLQPPRTPLHRPAAVGGYGVAQTGVTLASEQPPSKQ